MDPLGEPTTSPPTRTPTSANRTTRCCACGMRRRRVASATHAVVLGDKEHPELYSVYNEGCGSTSRRSRWATAAATCASRT
eukprot:2072848-Prymnesium_polylepis.1